MSTLVLEPYATQQRWQAQAPLTGEAWQELMAGYLGALARACAEAGPCIIGHIKALALFDGGGYVRISAVSATREPTVDGRVPDGLSTISLTLNVLVYGLSATSLQDLTWKAAAALAQARGVTVTEETLRDDSVACLAVDKHSHAS
jgi:hypothetical protein